MPLVDVRGFNLDPQVGTNFARGLQTGQQLQQIGRQNTQTAREQQVRQALSGVRSPEFAPQTEQQQMLAGQSQGLGGALAQAEQPQPVLSQEEKIRAAQEIDPAIANKMLKDFGLDDMSKREDMSRFAADLENTPFEQRPEKIMARSQRLRAEGRGTAQTDKLLDLDEQTQNRGLLGIQLADLTTKERLTLKEKAERGVETSAEQRAFEALIKDLPEKEKEKARRVKLGLSPRAVGSAVQTITEEGIAEDIGETRAIIKQREKFGELTGASRAKTIDKGFEKLIKIDLGIRNIDKAIKAIDEGASTGVMQSFSPSIRASSVELDNVRNTLALDVLNAATFGALSEKELDIVKETALPTKLSPPELKVWLQDRKIAEQKLKAYYQEQIDFLDQGGTVAGFLREKRRQGTEQAGTPQEAQTVGRFKVRVK